MTEREWADHEALNAMIQEFSESTPFSRETLEDAARVLVDPGLFRFAVLSWCGGLRVSAEVMREIYLTPDVKRGA